MTDRAPYSWVGAEFRAVASTQHYGGADRIEGVELRDLPLFSDEGGDFCEIARFAADGTAHDLPDFHLAQSSYSLMEPGAIKAWHLHRNQDDLWFVPHRPRLLVGLLDVREESSTYRASMRLAVGVGRPRLLYIPRGVAHGVANLGAEPAAVFYFVNQPFDAANPDEHRLPWDVLGKDFWSIRPG
jgi:dTDP-4-dehydrorhamnose 3,5-epimerase